MAFSFLPIRFDDAKAVTDYLKPALSDRAAEEFIALFLDDKNYLLADYRMAGDTETVNLDFRELFAAALRFNTRGLVLAHNHPGGDPTPSLTDVLVTRECARLARMLSMTLHDHLVFGDGDTVSFRSLGLL